MKGHIAFCPHFHQPHFQLHKTREEAYTNSYLPWLKLLQDAVNLDSFYINLHFSGPFLYWIRDEKKEYLDMFNRLMASGKVGIIGGLADEPFIQLSSRVDDYLYQLKKYDQLLQETIGIKASDWQGIHLVERECGESVLKEITRAASLIQAPAIYYLDVETFYQEHFCYPGSDNDYCRKHFGFNDPVSITTISHIPAEMLFYALRDEIGGQAFHVMPVHSQFRYQLLKRQSFTSADTVKIKPTHYYFYIKDALEKAYQMVKSYGRDIEPLLFIFEDAEKFGQWSKDPEGDREWLMEFFNLVDKDPDISFTGLRSYLSSQGYLDSYPVASSRSYIEWENWTAKRGIRGVTYGDERLRRVICRLRDVEKLQEHLEKSILGSYRQKLGIELPTPLDGIVQRSLLESAERYDFISHVLRQYHDPQLTEDYELLNRVRNLLYQEDPKWASRHPVYGSSPYYDVLGLAYMEMVIKILRSRLETANVSNSDLKPVTIRDWDYDGENEVLLENEEQTLVLDSEGGCISYHHVLASSIAGDYSAMREIITRDLGVVKAYNSVFRYSYPLVFTETDSSISYQFYEEGGRRERCRNSLRCEVFIERNNELFSLGDFDMGNYTINEPIGDALNQRVKMSYSQDINIMDNMPLKIDLEKEFWLTQGALQVSIKARCHGGEKFNLVLAPQLVTSATPSDEVEFRPRAGLGLISAQDEDQSECYIQRLSRSSDDDKLKFYNHKTIVKRPQRIDYIYQIRSGDGNCFNNCLSFSLNSNNRLPYLYVEPAVKHYYKNYVFPEQSQLGYHSSGLMIRPFLHFQNGEAACNIDISWELDTAFEEKNYEQFIWLVNGNDSGLNLDK
jgi:hypothetical protein